MSYADLRKGRWSASGQIYLVTAVTAGRQPFLANFGCARLLIREMRLLAELGLVESLAWVVMPDHMHWLLVLGEGADISLCLKRLKARSAQSMNRYLGRRGPFWQRCFHDHALRNEGDLLAIARYVVANPVRAGICGSVRQYSHWDAMWL